MWTEVGGTRLSPRQPLRERKLTQTVTSVSRQTSVRPGAWARLGAAAGGPPSGGLCSESGLRAPSIPGDPQPCFSSALESPLRVALWLPLGLGLGGTPAYSLAPSPLTGTCQVSLNI